ncbi:MAG: hypothetical protein AB1626_04270, partial [Candidatus Micrarchaeota archaeon]
MLPPQRRPWVSFSLARRALEGGRPRGLGRNPLSLGGVRAGTGEAQAEFRAGGPAKILLAAREQVLGRPLEIQERRFVDERGRMRPAAALSREEFLLRRFAESRPKSKVTSPQEYLL